MEIEDIGHETGQITGRRVVEGEAGAPLVEASFETQGEVLGVAIMNMGTFTSRQRADGSLFGDGQGLLQGPSGQSAPWQGSGIGQRAPDGTIVYQAAIFVEPSATKLDELAKTPLLVEFKVAPDGEVNAVARRRS